ncbi:MAG: hypothetical protein ACE5Q3_10570 [Alphaproteobacteria bacterium]
MYDPLEFVSDLVGRFNPNDPVNLTLFYTWLVVFTFTFMGLWRAPRRWVRLVCYVVNQAVSFGMLQAGVVTVAILFGRWREALVAGAMTFLLSWWLFADRRPRLRVGKVEALAGEPS